MFIECGFGTMEIKTIITNNDSNEKQNAALYSLVSSFTTLWRKLDN
jgi:hypothetical protein